MKSILAVMACTTFTVSMANWIQVTDTTMLASGGSNNIRQGKEYNEYTLSCEGNTITVWINGVQTNTVRDNSFREGLIGIGVSSYGVVPINVEFESLEIGVP